MTSSAPPRMSNRARLVSNYLRLVVTFASGLAIVRMLAEIGTSTLNIYLVVIAGTGFAFFMKVVMQESVIPMLGLSYDSQEGRNFAKTYWISFIFALVASLFAIIIFLALWVLRDLFDTGTLPESVFGIALATSAVRTVFSSLAAPPLHAVLIKGHVVRYNVALSLERLVEVIAVAGVLFLMPGWGETNQALAFFIGSSGLFVVLQVGIMIAAARSDEHLRVRRVSDAWEDTGWIRRIFGWNIAIVVAFLLYLRFSTLSINATFGEGPTVILGLVFLVIGYQRQISMGLVIGLDAMIARIAGARTDEAKKHAAMDRTILQSSYVQSVFSFASVAALWVLAGPLFSFWLGDSLDDGGWDLDTAVLLFRIMSAGVLARSLSENWMKVLNGKGLVGTYAPWLLVGGIIYASLMLFWLGHSDDVELVLQWLATYFALLYSIVHLLIIPEILCRSVRMSRRRLLRATLFPGAVILAPSILCLVLGSVELYLAAIVLTSLLLLSDPVRRRFGGYE